MNDADIIREFFDDAENAEKLHGFVLPMSAPCDALDRFEAALNEAHGRGNTWYDHFENVNSQLKIKQVEGDDITDRAVAAEAALRDAQTERDEALMRAQRRVGNRSGLVKEAYRQFRRAEAAEARVTELEAALTKIADGTILPTRFREIAAAALAKEDTDE